MKASSRKKVAIIGGGATGAIVALSILRKWGPAFEVFIVEPALLLAAGQAYRQQSEKNILNVRVEKMSAYEDDANDFVNWLREKKQNQQSVLTWPYLARQSYGDYLRSRLQSFDQNNWRHVQDRATSVQQKSGFLKFSCKAVLA